MACRRAVVPGLVAVLAAALPAQAGNIETGALIRLLSPDHVMTALADAGAAHLEKARGDNDNPMVYAEYRGLVFGVLFHNCEAAGCEWARFRASFERTDLSAGKKLELINAWNRAWAFGTAYVDEAGDLLLEQPIVATGGISRDNVRRTADAWLKALKRYGRGLGWE